MLSDEEKKALERIDYIQDFIIENGQYNADVNDMEYFSRIKNLIEKQSKEIEEYKKQIDLDNECEIALNSKVMDLEKEIEELKKPKYVINCKTNEITKLTNDFVSKDKIKAKIEEVKDGTYDAKIVLQSLLELEKE